MSIKKNKKRKPTIIRIKESDGNLFDFFSRNARYVGGKYLVERKGTILIDDSPALLFEKLKALELVNTDKL